MSSALLRWIAVVLAAVVVSVALSRITREAADAPATSDTAVIESYTLMASQGHLLLGAYSRFQWHHPGPLYFFLLAPFYVAAGLKTAGLHAGALAISLASFVLIASILLRRSRPVLALTTCGALALLAWRAAEAMASPWNPHVPLAPTAALVVATADVLSGNAVMLPVVALLASLSSQTHLALVPVALALGVIAFARACAGVAGGSATGRTWRRALTATAGVLAIVWALPLYEQATGAPGNLTNLWRFFLGQPHVALPFSVAVSAWSDMLVGVVRPDFYVAHGWPFVESPVHWAEYLTLAELAAVGLFSLRAVMRRERFDAAFGALLLLASAVALWSATEIREQVFDHDVFWMAGLGALNLAVTVSMLASVLSGPRVPRWLVATACWLLVGVAVLAGVRELRAVVRRSFDPPPDARIARALAQDLREYMTREHVVRPLVRIDQDAWGAVAGALLDLQKQGYPVAVEDDWVVMFTPAFQTNGREGAVIEVATPAEHLRLVDAGAPLISAHDPVYAHLLSVPPR